jgi:hypothetical protein
MHRRRLLGVLGAGAVAGLSGDRPAESARVAPLSVRIVPTSSREEGGRTIWTIGLYLPSQYFYVVVTNASGELIRLWKEWCSWGYFNLSFEVTDEKGRSVAVKKLDRDWTRNFPSWDIIPPGGHQVREVGFDPTTWENSPMPEAGRSRAVRMRAIYVIQPEAATKKHGIWTGRVSSPEDSYELIRK